MVNPLVRWTASISLLLSGAAYADADSTMALVEQWVHGYYNNSAQAQADLERDIPDSHHHRLMHQLLVPVKIPALRGHTVFQQAATDGSMNPRWIVRLGILQFFVDEKTGLVRQRELAFKRQDDFKNAHLNPEKLASLTAADFEFDPLCDFYVTLNPDGERIAGPMPDNQCLLHRPGLEKPLIAEDRIEITADSYSFLGRFLDDAGNVMWGTPSDELNRLVRISTTDDYGLEQGQRVLIFGASKGTGLEIARALTAAGTPVTAFVRPSSDTTALRELDHVAFEVGDAMVPEQVRAAFDSHYHRAVISTLGCRSCDGARPDFEGNRNVVDAALATGVNRFVLITVIGAGDSADAPPRIARWFLKEVIELKTQAENYLMTSGLEYTILRPGALKDSAGTGRGVLSDDRTIMGIIGRADLAALSVECLETPATVGNVYSTVDPELSWPWDMF
jgi:uncharacterized protein YbjT (DUF2867 family)